MFTETGVVVPPQSASLAREQYGLPREPEVFTDTGVVGPPQSASPIRERYGLPGEPEVFTDSGVVGPPQSASLTRERYGLPGEPKVFTETEGAPEPRVASAGATSRPSVAQGGEELLHLMEVAGTAHGGEGPYQLPPVARGRQAGIEDCHDPPVGG